MAGASTLVSRIKAAVAERATKMLADVSVTGRTDADRASAIVYRLATEPRMEAVWKQLARRKRSGEENGGPGEFYYGGMRVPSSEERRVADAVRLFEQACYAAIWIFPTRTHDQIEAVHTARLVLADQAAEFAPDLAIALRARAEQLREPAEYKLRVERSRTAPERKGFVLTLAGSCEAIFGSKMPSVVALIAQVALEWHGITHEQVREMLRSQGGRGLT